MAAALHSGLVMLMIVLGLAHACAAAAAAKGQVHRRPTHPTVLGSCPLPGFCYRTHQSRQDLSSKSKWFGTPSDADLATYKAAVQKHIQSDLFKVSR